MRSPWNHTETSVSQEQVRYGFFFIRHGSVSDFIITFYRISRSGRVNVAPKALFGGGNKDVRVPDMPACQGLICELIPSIGVID